MASSRKTATNENISTYGNATRDYTALATWETATDIDLVSATQSEVLECYDDSASFDDNMALDGAICNSSYFRIIRPASGQGHDGTPINGVYFVCTTDIDVFNIVESYSSIQDLIVKLTINSAAQRHCFVYNEINYVSFIGCIANDAANSGAGVAHGLGGGGGIGYFVDCLSCNCDVNGFRIWPSDSNQVFLYSCTSVNNGQYGFYNFAALNSPIVKNCCASGNTTADWGNGGGGWTKVTCTAEGANPTYVNASGNDFHLAAGDTVCRGNGTDLSADGNYAFDDDIDFSTRVAWDIGFDERSWLGKIIGITNPAKINGVAIANIANVMGQ